MKFEEGVVITSKVPEALDSPAERRRISEELIDALVESTPWTGSRAARGLRQAHRLPRPPAAPLQRPVGAQQDARAALYRRSANGLLEHRVARR